MSARDTEGRAESIRQRLRNGLTDAPADFVQVGDRVVAFLRPLWADLGSRLATPGNWPAGGPWR